MSSASPTHRWARRALLIGAALLAAAVGLTVWDSNADDTPAPVVVTGKN